MAQYLYEEIKEYLMNLVRENKNVPHYKLPSENQLAVKFSTTRITAKRALNELQKEGYINRMHGKGSFIAPDSKTLPPPQGTDFICMLLPNIGSRFISRLVSGAKEYCSDFGYTLLLMVEPEDRLNRLNLISEIVKRGIKGIIVFPNSKANYNKDLLLLALKSFPIVFVDRYMANLDVSSVSSLHEEAGRMAVKELTARGCKNIGFVTVPAPFASSVHERIFGYERAHMEYGMFIKKDYVLPVSKNEEYLDEKLERYFSEHPEMDGLLSYGDTLGIHVYKALKKLNIRVPEQMKVIFLDDEYSEYADVLPFSPSCIVQQSSEIGRQAAELLVKYITGQSKHDEKLQLHYRFIERDSTKTE